MIEGRREFVRHTVRIPLSDELLYDFGLAGPRYRTIPDRDRWASAWHESHRIDWPWFSLRLAPPWEEWDRPAIPSTFTFWPRIEALFLRLMATARKVARQRRLLRYRLIGARDGFLLRSDQDEDASS